MFNSGHKYSQSGGPSVRTWPRRWYSACQSELKIWRRQVSTVWCNLMHRICTTAKNFDDESCWESNMVFAVCSCATFILLAQMLHIDVRRHRRWGVNILSVEWRIQTFSRDFSSYDFSEYNYIIKHTCTVSIAISLNLAFTASLALSFLT